MTSCDDTFSSNQLLLKLPAVWVHFPLADLVPSSHPLKKCVAKGEPDQEGLVINPL